MTSHLKYENNYLCIIWKHSSDIFYVYFYSISISPPPPFTSNFKSLKYKSTQDNAFMIYNTVDNIFYVIFCFYLAYNFI